MTVGDRIGRTGFDAVATKDAAVVVNVVNLCVTFSTADAIGLSVIGRLDVNAVRRARRRAQEAGYALFQAILVALQDVHAAKTFLEHRSAIRAGTVGIVLHLGRL